MISEQQLISYKQNFTGQQFQWVKTDRPELIGKLVKCRDVDPRGNQVIAVFDDGSEVDVREINNKLLMIHGDLKPLSKEEVQSIYSPKTAAKQPAPFKDPNEQPSSSQASTKATPQQAPKVEKIEVNPFEMFNSDETDLSIKIKIKLPDKKLLKMMYNNAEDKDSFLDQLSKYVLSMINNNVINESLGSMLDSSKNSKDNVAKKPSGEVKLTEINEK